MKDMLSNMRCFMCRRPLLNMVEYLCCINDISHVIELRYNNDEVIMCRLTMEFLQYDWNSIDGLKILKPKDNHPSAAFGMEEIRRIDIRGYISFVEWMQKYILFT